MNMPNMSGWSGWNRGKGGDLLDDRAMAAESRLNAIKKSAKIFKKGVEDSLKTNPKSGKEDLESRKRRTAEMALGEHIASAVQVLNDEKFVMLPQPTPPQSAHSHDGEQSSSQLYPSLPGSSGGATAMTPHAAQSAMAMQPAVSPLNTLLERFANLEKTLGHMVAASEMVIYQFIHSDTPIAYLLNHEIPAVASSKADLERLIKRQNTSQNNLEKEERKCEKLRTADDPVDDEVLNNAEEKRERLAYELENVKKDVALERDKLSSTLLTLVSRENRYAESVLELMRIKKKFYEDAYLTIEAELPYMERFLQETTTRPIFGEPLDAHLRSTQRIIAYPIALAVSYLRQTDLNDEGLFRISPKQIKVDKFKAGLDSHQPLSDLLPEADVHVMSGLLKSYLRELPEPLLGKGRVVYQQWIDAVKIPEHQVRISAIKHILNEDLNMNSYRNIQYLVHFLAELTDKEAETKMTARNIAIVLGPTLLWSDQNKEGVTNFESAAVDSVISVIVTLIENYPVIFPEDLPPDLEVDIADEIREIVLAQKAEEALALEEAERAAAAAGGYLQVPARSSGSGTVSATAGGGGDPYLASSGASPNHKRKASIRSMGRNFMRKINETASASHTASKTPSPKEDVSNRDPDTARDK